MNQSLRKLATIALGLGFIYVVLRLGHAALFEDNPSTRVERWFAALSAVALLILVSLGFKLINVSIRGLVIGEDNRTSTSKVQVFLWTYALVAVLLTIVIAHFLGASDSYNQLIEDGLSEEYLLLLGGPFAAAIVSKAIIAGKVQKGELTKPDGEADADTTDQLAQVVSDDNGDTDLVDTQYLLFNLVALVYFLGAFIQDPSSGLPDMPGVLVGLTSISAAGYVSNKAVQGDVPEISSLLPGRGRVGDVIQIFGRNLLIPREVAAETEEAETDAYERYYILFAGVRAERCGVKWGDAEHSFLVVDPESPPQHHPSHGSGGDDRIFVKVPQPPAGREHVKVEARNLKGTPSKKVEFDVSTA